MSTPNQLIEPENEPAESVKRLDKQRDYFLFSIAHTITLLYGKTKFRILGPSAAHCLRLRNPADNNHKIKFLTRYLLQLFLVLHEKRNVHI